MWLVSLPILLLSLTGAPLQVNADTHIIVNREKSLMFLPCLIPLFKLLGWTVVSTGCSHHRKVRTTLSAVCSSQISLRDKANKDDDTLHGLGNSEAFDGNADWDPAKLVECVVILLTITKPRRFMCHTSLTMFITAAPSA